MGLKFVAPTVIVTVGALRRSWIWGGDILEPLYWGSPEGQPSIYLAVLMKASFRIVASGVPVLGGEVLF